MERINKKQEVKPKAITALGFVCLAHPETGEAQMFTLEHASSIMSRQLGRNMRPEQCWKLSDENFTLDKNGNIIERAD